MGALTEAETAETLDPSARSRVQSQPDTGLQVGFLTSFFRRFEPNHQLDAGKKLLMAGGLVVADARRDAPGLDPPERTKDNAQVRLTDSEGRDAAADVPVPVRLPHQGQEKAVAG
jgi:hypothetical protein